MPVATFPIAPAGSPDGGSSDASGHSPSRNPPSSDAASTDSSSSDVDEAPENDYGTQDNENDYVETLPSTLENDYVDIIMNDQIDPEVLESDSDCPHLRAKLVDPGFVKSYTAAVSWRARNQMQSSNDTRGRTKHSKARFLSLVEVFLILCPS